MQSIAIYRPMSINIEDVGMSYLTPFGKDSISRVQHASAALQQGKGIILVDDEDRENEGDLIFAAEKISISDVNQLIQDCSGIICLCLTEEKAAILGLKPMVLNNTSPYQTAFTSSIEAKVGITTGVSAHDRFVTIHTAVNANSPDALNQPGHVFPLIARRNGVLDRRGHTEGSIDLMKITGLHPSSVLCELMNKDGTMKKLPELIDYAITHQLTVLSVEDIYQYRQVIEI
jgi:3,4-dihydroxy 2-butanone 4-phosphate synthase